MNRRPRWSWKLIVRKAPCLAEFKKMVALVMVEIPNGSVTDIYHAIKRRCPDWSVTPYRVQKAVTALKNSAKKSTDSHSRSSKDAFGKVFPHDVVELRPRAARKRSAQQCYRGQVLRVAGYDDGEAPDTEDIPPGHCAVFWLGTGLEQWVGVLTKESSVRVLDRPWVLGDRVARVEDPRSLGTIVKVHCRLRLSGVHGPTEMSPEVSVQDVRTVGGFRAEDWVVDESSRWVGKVEEAVFRVEVELCRKGEQRSSRSKRRHGPAVCAFQVSSEGLLGLEPAGCEDVGPQELSPHFPGQRVRAPARLWRQAEWLTGTLGRSPRRGNPIFGVVTSVECCLLAVRWLAGVSKDGSSPDEWVSPDSVRSLSMPNNSEGWTIGDHVQAPRHWNCQSAVITESCTQVDVCWSNGTLEEKVSSLRLCPRPHVSAHDFLPHDFVTRSESATSFADPATVPVPAPYDSLNQIFTDGLNRTFQREENFNEEEYTYPVVEEATQTPAVGEILPTEILGMPQADMPIGVVTSVDLQARTAVVQWTAPASVGCETVETEEVSVFELTDHPAVDTRLGDAVLIPEREDSQWAGRVSALRTDGSVRVELLDGSSEWLDVRSLIVVDDDVESSQEGGDDDDVADSDATRSYTSCFDAIEEVDEVATNFSDAEEERNKDFPDIQECFHQDEASLKPARDGDASDEDTDELILLRAGAFDGASRALARDSSSSSSLGRRLASVTEGDFDIHSSTSLDMVCGGSSSSSSSPCEPVAFDICEEDVEPSDHAFLSSAPLATRQRTAAIRREMEVLRKGLSDGSQKGSSAPIIVRSFASRSDLFRCMVVGPPGTPYALVPFFFDIAIPAEYPRDPPLAHFHAHHSGVERLNPNLYVDGKVCLSLLGTWSGPAWDSQRSTILQVLVSLQGLVLVEEPYFNEPGHECDVDTEQGRQSSALYNEHARLLSLRAALSCAQKPPRGFEEIVASYFARVGPRLLEECEEALREPRALQTSDGFRKVLAKLLPRLQERWGGVPPS